MLQLKDKAKLLNDSLNRVMKKAISEGSILPSKGGNVSMGNFIIVKVGKAYTIMNSITLEKAYSGVPMLELALLIAKYETIKNISHLRDILNLNNKYQKLSIDVDNYSHSIKYAQQKDDTEKLCFLLGRLSECEFLIDELRAIIKYDSEQLLR